MTTALKLTSLGKVFPVGKRLFGPPKALVRAVQPLSLTVEEGETLGIVGEFRLRQVNSCTHAGWSSAA